MRTQPRGSHAAHIAASMSHNGRAACYDFRPDPPRDRTGFGWKLAVIPAALFVLGRAFIGVWFHV